MKRTKSRKTIDKITGYLLQIAGGRKDAEQAAEIWTVRIRIIPELNGKDEVFAVCPADDVREIREWHDSCIGRLRAGGEPYPGDLMRIEQPPEDVDTTFTEEKRERPVHPHLGRRHRPLKITNPRKIKFDEL